MKEKTDWTTNAQQGSVHTSGSQPGRSYRGSATSSSPRLLKDRNIVKAGFAVIAGILIAAMAKGTRDSDYYKD